MRQTALTLVLIFSLAFNIAFVGIWVYNRTAPRNPQAERPPAAGRRAEGAARRSPNGPWAALNLSPEQERRMRESWRTTAVRMRALNAELSVAFMP